jgi:hypothetical protein
MTNTQTRKWTREEIATLLTCNPGFRQRALLKLYSKQTQDEQTQAVVNKSNNVGFRSCDAKFLTSLAKFCIRTNSLSNKQDAALLKKLPRYVGQLCDIANGKR